MGHDSHLNFIFVSILILILDSSLLIILYSKRKENYGSTSKRSAQRGYCSRRKAEDLIVQGKGKSKWYHY